MKRLFVAVDVDESTRAEIAALSTTLEDQVAATLNRTRITWVHTDRLHLTIEFFGDASDAIEQRVMTALASPFSIAPFRLSFEGLGIFPRSGTPRVLWLGIAEGLTGLRALHAELRARLGDAAMPADEFNPHLTLARFRDRVSRLDVKGMALMKAAAGPCSIDRVTLYESHLSPKGPTYTQVAQGAFAPCT